MIADFSVAHLHPGFLVMAMSIWNRLLLTQYLYPQDASPVGALAPAAPAEATGLFTNLQFALKRLIHIVTGVTGVFPGLPNFPREGVVVFRRLGLVIRNCLLRGVESRNI